ncbi:MAG: hypothetical protein U1C55_00580 [Smithellaceae bacterium]|nr:hypothetical protein [Smithellaceae bacterium]
MAHFHDHHIGLASKAFSGAETLTGLHFRLNRQEMKRHRYEVKTLAFLDEKERSDRAFAHLCKYQYDESSDGRGDAHFYRVCLQDDRILDAVSRARSYISLGALLLYIATHELVHVVRFDRGEIDFDASGEEREREEERVHAITHEVLQPSLCRNLTLIHDCFSSRYKIGDLFN